MINKISQLYQSSANDIALAATSGSLTAVMMDGSILIPAAVSLFAPILKDMIHKVIIPLFRKKLKIKPENDVKEEAQP